MLVRWRPNAANLVFMAVGAAAFIFGISLASLAGFVIALAAGVMLALFALPIAVSTVGRVPVIAVTDEGIRLPLMGVSLPWDGVASTSRTPGPPRRPNSSFLVIFPKDREGTLSQIRPWLRREARDNILQYGAPIAVSDTSLDHSLDEIEAAIADHRPRHHR